MRMEVVFVHYAEACRVCHKIRHKGDTVVRFDREAPIMCLPCAKRLYPVETAAAIRAYAR